MRRFRRVFQLILLVFVIGATVILIGARNNDPKITKVTSQLKPQAALKLSHHYQKSKTATVFLHGYNGGAYSTNYLIKHAEKAGAAQKALVVHVYKNGVMAFKGYWHQSIKNPMVQVVFQDNHASQKTQVYWLHQVLVQLKTRYGVARYNAVGHSLGANDIVNQALKYGHDKRLPKLNKIVTIGGPFDGLTGYLNAETEHQVRQVAAKPVRFTHHFAAMLKHRQNFPQNVKMLNVIGDTDDGFNNDGYVSVASARSIGYVLQHKLATYEEQFYSGTTAAHCALNQNPQVARSMISFLW
ncbi:alpha/beta hydrolase [Lactiplantibacillus sp. WILCCON 0030]|uniref:Alpha/beta hydrolase n=1 Tax=Lactiplantibacillus brownii TaxID=3069269 RepID=A0ABU1AC76_9LACO|nr:alpha/beta hydrolase [Lactiplantibacillus brownii]MDQ7938516.1 alpha/beta hydrolase [Lactiplantibacillus brownii]